MGFEINKVLDLKVTSIPVGKDKSINIAALNDDASRQKLYSLLRVCFDKTGKKKGVLEAVEMKALYNEAGGKIDKQKLSKLLSKFKFALFLYKQGAPQKANETEQAVKELIGKLKSENPDVCANAILALGRIGPAAVPALIKALDDNDVDVRNKAAEALDNIGPAAVPALIKALDDANKDVRSEAAWVLGGIGPAAKAVVPALIKALSDENPDVRSSAAQALGNIGSAAKAAVPALINTLKDEDDYVSRTAHWALNEIRKK